MTLAIHQSRRDRPRKRADGTVVVYERHWLDFKDPKTGRRRLLAFRTEDEAATAKAELERVHGAGHLAGGKTLTVAEAMARWLADRKSFVRPQTARGYGETVRNIVGPVLQGTPEQRREYKRTGEKPPGAEFLPVLGHRRVAELTTAAIRDWHRAISDHVGGHTASRALMFLRAALVLAQEEFGVSPPIVPKNLGRGQRRRRKTILEPHDIARLLDAAEADTERGIYFGFGFLAGTRPSEQLGLLWSEVDLERSTIHIRRVQDRSGKLVEMTKTAAGVRDVPMGPRLRRMLLEWKLRCPRRDGELHRVFPGLGQPQAWPKPRKGGGTALLYRNFLRRFWRNPLKRLGFEGITPHSARHSYISILQAEGIEIALVAKVVGHASPVVTAGHYSHAVRGAGIVAETLERAFTNV